MKPKHHFLKLNYSVVLYQYFHEKVQFNFHVWNVYWENQMSIYLRESSCGSIKKKALSPNWGCGIYLIPQDPSYITLHCVVGLEGNLKLAFTSLRHCLVWGRNSACFINFTDPSKFEYLWVMLDFIHSSSTLFYKVLNA